MLTLGGGPGATILEVAIYQALRFEFNIDRAVALALIQIVLAGTIAGAIAASTRTAAIEPPAGGRHARPDLAQRWARLGDAAAIALATAIFVLPLAGVIVPSLACAHPPSGSQTLHCGGRPAGPRSSR